MVVYNNRATLKDCFLRSEGLGDASLVLIDNRSQNLGLPVHFNNHKQHSAAAWLVFCHQDFIVLDKSWVDRIRHLPKSACYGPIGRDISLQWRGQLKQTDGTLLGSPAPMATVTGVDEICLIVPRSIFMQVNFDVMLPFDLYGHDFCLAALDLGYPTRVMDLECEHRSRSVQGDVLSDRFLAAKAHFVSKHQGRGPLVTTTFDVPLAQTAG